MADNGIRNAYVTGSERGLGLAIARELTQRGYRVFAGAFLAEHGELDSLAAAYPDQVRVVPLDVTSQDSVQSAAKAVRSAAGSLDLLVNNAGLAIDRSKTILEPLVFEDMLRIYEVNALGPLRVTQSVLDLLTRGNRGVLLNISSIAGSIEKLSRTTQYGYTMSKAAVNVQSKLIRNHLGPKGLTVLAVHPGAMPTLILGDPDITKKAPVSTERSARGIVDLSERDWPTEGPLFVDFEGTPLPW